MGEGGDGYGYAPSGRIWLRLRAQRRKWLYLGTLGTICAALYLRGKLKSGPNTIQVVRLIQAKNLEP